MKFICATPIVTPAKIAAPAKANGECLARTRPANTVAPAMNTMD